MKEFSRGVGGVTVSMVAFQAVDPGSIPSRRSFAELTPIKKSAFDKDAWSKWGHIFSQKTIK